MEIRGAGRKTAQNWSLDLANVVESAFDQGLAKVGRGFAIGRRRRRICG